MTLWRPLTWTGSIGIELVAKQTWSTIESEYLGLLLQCFSYRRFFASPDASSLIWTQVERFGRFFPNAIFNASSPCRTNEIKIEVQSKYRGMNCKRFVSSLFTKHADVFPALCVVASASADLPITNASPEQGIFNPEQDFDESCGTDFWKENSTSSRPADENLHRRPAEQPDGYRRALQLWRSQRIRRILWAGLRRSPSRRCDCRPMSRFTATLTCYL